MADIFGDEIEENGGKASDFEKLLASYDKGAGEELKKGERISGKIISIGSSSVYVDTGTKSDGVVEKKELLDENGELPLNVGDTIELFVVSITESEVVLSKALSGQGGFESLRDAWESRMPVVGKVVDVIKGGFHVEIMGKRAFCPISQIDSKFVEDAELYKGLEDNFIISRFEENGRNIVASRREYLNIDIEKNKELFFKENKEGDIVKGTIVKLMPYGAFVELIPGIEGMVHISELSWSRVEKPEEEVSVGQEIMVKILSISVDDKKRSKLSLSIKQAGNDPWDLVDQTFNVGDQVTGKVVRCAPFGAFVEIAKGTEGLVHLSEMSYTKRIVRAEDVVSTGEMVQVVIKEIQKDKKRISLSIKDAHGDPWNGISMKYQAGQKISGSITRRENFGLFVTLEEGITALLPSSKTKNSENPSLFEKLKPGDTVEAVIEDIDEEKRRMSLAPADSIDKNDWKKFAAKTKVSSGNSMGTMADLFNQAMKKK